MTLHNLAYHGWTPRERARPARAARRATASSPRDADGIDLLRAGIERAELVNTVSPGFAAEALTPGFGMGLDGALRAKGDRFIGILNGLDTDGLGPGDRRRPRRAVLARRTGPARPPAGPTCWRASGSTRPTPAPVLGMIGRLDPQKGFDLARRRRAGAARARRPARRPGQRPPGARGPVPGARAGRTRTASRCIERFDREMARRIYAGADLFLMPSRFEPCGQGQMIALRYGTPPIVHRTGGLADTVVDETRAPGRGDRLRASTDADGRRAARGLRAGDARCARPAARPGTALLDRGMAVDFDWVTGSAPRYVEAYRRAVAIRRARVDVGDEPASGLGPVQRPSKRRDRLVGMRPLRARAARRRA